MVALLGLVVSLVVLGLTALAYRIQFSRLRADAYLVEAVGGGGEGTTKVPDGGRVTRYVLNIGVVNRSERAITDVRYLATFEAPIALLPKNRADGQPLNPEPPTSAIPRWHGRIEAGRGLTGHRQFVCELDGRPPSTVTIEWRDYTKRTWRRDDNGDPKRIWRRSLDKPD